MTFLFVSLLPSVPAAGPSVPSSPADDDGGTRRRRMNVNNDYEEEYHHARRLPDSTRRNCNPGTTTRRNRYAHPWGRGFLAAAFLAFGFVLAVDVLYAAWVLGGGL